MANIPIDPMPVRKIRLSEMSKTELKQAERDLERALYHIERHGPHSSGGVTEPVNIFQPQAQVVPHNTAHILSLKNASGRYYSNASWLVNSNTEIEITHEPWYGVYIVTANIRWIADAIGDREFWVEQFDSFDGFHKVKARDLEPAFSSSRGHQSHISEHMFIGVLEHSFGTQTVNNIRFVVRQTSGGDLGISDGAESGGIALARVSDLVPVDGGMTMP